MRLTSQLQRQTIYALSPRAAGIVTVYGATAEPTSFKNAHLAALQSARRGLHLANKLDRIVLKGVFAKRRSASTPAAQEEMPFLTREFRESLLAPEKMLSHALYSPEGLRRVLSGSDEDWQTRSYLILKLATVEELCRELGFEPERDFLTSAPMERTVTHS
jgi:hypothetical protein